MKIKTREGWGIIQKQRTLFQILISQCSGPYEEVWSLEGLQYCYISVGSLRKRRMRRHESTARKLSSRSWSERSSCSGKRRDVSWQHWRSNGNCRRRMWMFCLEVSSKHMLCSISREGCEQFHFIYCIKKSVQTLHMLPHIWFTLTALLWKQNWLWLGGLMLVLHTEWQWNLIWPVKLISVKSVFHIWASSVHTIIFLYIYIP